ncbi:dsDNA nuclease domain-containing protein [Enterococcus durans]|jgi:hypothetical protein|uniref:dsDNA nuclease domain-containing protein n=1 Tax=Enterococcus durans TaxID=53345 RepID=UPI0035640B13|nr:hypothetical protein [Neobacillus sp.]
MDYEADYAGARSKNRFRFEIYWGLDKLLKEMTVSQNFYMIFDYVCDIEIHFSDHYEFYQVKTKNGKSYTINNLTNRGEKKNSVIGTLYKIRDSDLKNKTNRSKLAIVSNLKLSDSALANSANLEFELNSLSKNNVEKIETALKKEFGIEKIDLSNIFFINTDLAVSNFRDTMVGRINNYYKSQYGDDALKPAALLNVLSEEIQQKADFEEPCESYGELLKKKGISTERIDFIFEKYSERSISMIEKCKAHINSVIKNYKKRINYMKHLTSIVTNLGKDFFLQNLEQEIKQDIIDKIDEFSDGELFYIAKEYVTISSVNFPIEYSIEEKELLSLIALINLEDQL